MRFTSCEQSGSLASNTSSRLSRASLRHLFALRRTPPYRPISISSSTTPPSGTLLAILCNPSQRRPVLKRTAGPVKTTHNLALEVDRQFPCRLASPKPPILASRSISGNTRHDQRPQGSPARGRVQLRDGSTNHIGHRLSWKSPCRYPLLDTSSAASAAGFYHKSHGLNLPRPRQSDHIGAVTSALLRF